MNGLAAEKKPKKKQKQFRAEPPEPQEVDEISSTSTAAADTPEDFKFRCQMVVANFFFRTAVAFRIVEHDAFRQMFEFICPELIMPNRHQLAGELLEATYESERSEVIKVLRKQSYVALVSDGWSNPRRESLINFIVVAPKLRPLLWSCRVTGADIKTGAYMADMFSEVIDEIEAEIGRGKELSLSRPTMRLQ